MKRGKLDGETITTSSTNLVRGEVSFPDTPSSEFTDATSHVIISNTIEQPFKRSFIEELLFKADAELSLSLHKTFEEINQLRNEALKQIKPTWTTLADAKIENTISTGIEELDQVLKGGFRSEELIEFCGSSCTGKTQLCFELCINQVMNLPNKKVLFIDTCNSFEARRILQMIAFRTENEDEVISSLSRVEVLKAFAVNSFLQVLDGLLFIENEPEKKQLIIIDSIANIISNLIGKKDSYGSRVAHLILQLLRKISQVHSCPVILVNYAVLRKANDNQLTPMLGKWWVSAPNIRFLLSHSSSQPGKIQCELISSVRCPTGGRLYFEVLERGPVFCPSKS